VARCSSYDFGECTWGACELASWVPEGLGNAKDWPDNAARKGYALTTVPTVGAIVVYLPGRLYSEFGHCGEVIAVHSPSSFDVREMNYAAWDVYDTRTSAAYSVKAFILPPGVAAGAGTAPPWLPLPNRVAALELAWGAMQSLWGPEIDAVINGSAAVAATLDAWRRG